MRRMKKARRLCIFDVIASDHLAYGDFTPTVPEGVIVGVRQDPGDPRCCLIKVDLARDGVHEYPFDVDAYRMVRYNTMDEVENAGGFRLARPDGGPRHSVIDPNVESAVIETESRFDRVGGTSALKDLVDRVFVLVLARPELAEKFRGFSVQDIKHHAVELFVALLKDDMSLYRGKQLAIAHAGLAVDDVLYDQMLKCMTRAMSEKNIDQDVQTYLLEKLEGARSLIVQA